MNDFQLNDVVVRPRLNEIQIEGRNEKLPAKFIDVLMVLAERQGQVFGKSELLKRVWNDPMIGEDSLANAVWMLRKTLGDDAKRPAYIETVPRRGYRLIANVAQVAPVTPTGAASALCEPDIEPIAVAQDAALPQALPASAPAAQPILIVPVAAEYPARRWLAVALLLTLLAILAGWWRSTPMAGRAMGAEVMAFRTGGDVSSIGVPVAGVALVAEKSGVLYALDTQHGTERWRFAAAGPLQAPAQTSDPRLFLGGEDGYVYALDFASGREIWRYAAGHSVQTVPLARDDRTIYGDIKGNVQALRSSDAQVLWHVQFDSRVIGSILGPLDVAVLRTLDGTVAALDRGNGSLRWKRRFGGPLSDLVAGSAAQIVFASDAGYVIALDARDGASLWQAELPAAEIEPLVVGEQVYALGRYGDLVALRASDGSALWRTRLDIGDVHKLVWWQDRIVVVLDAGVLGLIDPADGRVEHTLKLPETPGELATDGTRLIISAPSGRVLAIERAMLDSLKGSQLLLDADARLRTLDQRDTPTQGFAIEPLQAGANLPQLLWRASVVGHVQDVAAGNDNTVYLSDERAAMALMAGDGALRWRQALSPAMGTQFALAGANLYFGRRDRHVYALDRTTGKQSWRFATGAQVISPPTVVDGRVYVGSDDRRLYALRADSGQVVWSFETKRPVRGGAVVGSGRVVFGGADRNVYALDVESGALLWQFSAEDWVVAHPLLVGKRVFVGSGNGDFHALDLDSGKELWRFHSGAKVWFRPAADADCVYFGSGDGHIYALDQATGMERWRYRTGAAAEGTVVLDAGVLYAGSHDFHLYALDSKSGKPLWRMRTGGSVFNPDLAAGMLYVASADQHLYALKL